MPDYNLRHDEPHARDVHDRWLAKRNRVHESPSYRETWWAEQCGGCRFWIPLVAPLGLDYGVCSNPESPLDGLARFEHDGCEAFTASTDGWAQPD